MLNKSILELENNFQKYYNDVLNKTIEKLEKRRKIYLSIIILYFLSIVFSIIIYFSYLYKIDQITNFNLIIFIITPLAIIFGYYLYKFFNNSITNDKILFDKIIQYFDGFRFFPEYQNILSGKYETIDDNIIRQSNLIENYNVSRTDDEIYGNYKDINIVISEKTLYQRENDYDGSVKNKKIFRGVFILMDMNKKFNSHIIIKKKSSIKNLEFNIFKKEAFEVVNIEDVVFSKTFCVFSNDQIESRYILTTGFIDRFIQLTKIFSTNNIGCSFYNNKVLIAINTNKDIFKYASLFSKINYNSVKQAFNDIISILKIIDILKLDNRIGL